MFSISMNSVLEQLKIPKYQIVVRLPLQESRVAGDDGNHATCHHLRFPKSFFNILQHPSKL